VLEEDRAPVHLDVTDQPVLVVETADQIGVAARGDRLRLLLGDSIGETYRRV